ncbi:hypoxia up-regulated protein 1 isoform X1 [Sapajus apella]|uniref:Hypoxia up-regulated protein 1 n=1 Tax=Sapajus apella TaxID=9515 RepID=A0A6J3IG53_SAPAP|nr:hypoxia up-regulated protein 1 isoform X1 [Sapajus apella]XP_032141141.1 hypoxia up-regulated protein 1 isoform X1 [Sapajus apella]XP_032141142.1 hypoxia up-regulated protein 1 isoform X1 [Sapajus apella]XP_032141143.1 hypoxia up-regulated protein 1 isoform X1 [Sapajus apella]XP_032141144.1 hypoxia up-regulated protein 1 isoform X1 [Sapajus apella]XP_032141148.1 hypoxia up-regulated protein 1 isoform X1 [Sapajus apella]
MAAIVRRQRQRRRVCWALVAVLLADLLALSDTLAVMSVDLGSESMKVAIVKPGVPMEIVLNKESRRKTPVIVTLKENERFFGDSAASMAIKNPKATLRYFQHLLGKQADNPHVALYQARFPEHELTFDPQRQTVHFQISPQLQFSPEEVLGMILNYSRSLAEDFAEQPIKDAVITVPVFFNQAERRAVLHAARMAGLKVLQLINDNTATALSYGVFRRKDINTTAQNIMFYDMGSGSTVCTIVTYQTVKTKEAGMQPQLQIRGVGFDRTLGGLEMELRLREHLAGLFNEQRKGQRGKDVQENPRAMAKLLREANRLKTVLSANADHMAQIEGLMDDVDFKAKVTRVEFEELCADLFERVPGPVQQALQSAEMSLDEIEQVILVGGATRVPKVQEVLLKAVGKEELGKNINADEAAAMGAVYQAAVLSKAFKVKPFVVRDAVVYPILVEFTREVEEEPGVHSLKHNKRVLFSRMGPYPQRKVITFNRYSHDFNFHINYGDLGFLGPEDLRVFGSQNLTTVKLKGVGDSFKKYTDYESKGIKAHFNLDESGVLSLDRVESVFETLVEDSPEEESTLTKLGNTISSLFGGGTTPDAKENGTDTVQEEEESPAEGSKDEPGEQVELKEEAEAPVKDASQPPPPEPKGDAAPEGEKATEKENGDKSEAQKPSEKAEAAGPEGIPPAPEGEKKQKPARKQRMVEEIGVELVVLDLPDLPEDKLARSVQKLQDLTLRDLEKQEREKAANSLEAFIFETQDKMYQPEYKEVSTEEQREEISGKLSATSTWLEDEGFGATTAMLKEKLAELRKLCQGLFFRVEERKKWPERLSALDNLLNHSSMFLKGARLIPEMDQIFTEVEMTTLEKVINETWAWKNATLAEQAKLPATEKPVLLSKDIEAKMMALDREVQYLLNKAKFTKPRPRPKDKNETRAEPPLNASASDQEEKVIPPAGQTEDAEPISEPEKVETAGSEPGDTEPLELGGPGAAESEQREQSTGQKRPLKNDEL